MNFQVGNVKLSYIYCINLKHRRDRKTKMKKQAKKLHFPLKWWTTKLNKSDPEAGRFMAHMNIIKQAKHKRYKSIMILEDDAKFWIKSMNIVDPPDDWDMLYLGGNPQEVYTDDCTDLSETWKRVGCLTTHAYIVHYRMYQKIIDRYNKFLGKIPLDVFYCNHVHPDSRVYLTTPELVSQYAGYSDVKGQRTTYNQQITKKVNPGSDATRGNPDIDQVETEFVTADDDSDQLHCVLKSREIPEPELPHVTLITPTCNRPEMIEFMIWSFYKQKYPPNKLTWIIADDGDEDRKVGKYLALDDDRIKYINCKLPPGQYLPMSKKLNLCMTYTGSQKNQVIMHFFDYVYYPPMSTMSRVKALMQNDAKECIGCTEFGVFDFEKNQSYISYFPDSDDRKTVLCLQSMAYRKSFWKERNWDESKYTLPGHYFIEGRVDRVAQLPYEFVLITLDSSGLQKSNGNNRKEKLEIDPRVDQKNNFSYFNTWDVDTKEFIVLLKQTI